MAVLFTEPRYRPLSTIGGVYPGAKLYSYQTLTVTLQNTWSNSTLSVANTNPIVADGNGLFGAIYLDESLEPYKFVLKDSSDNTIWTIDPYTTGLSQAGVSDALYPIEAGETGVLSTLWRRGHVYRYVLSNTPNVTDMTTAFQNAALSSLNPYAPNDGYLITGSIPLRDDQVWQLDGARISMSGTTLEVFTVAAGIDGWALDGDWQVTGDNGAAGATVGTAAAVKIIDSMRWRVKGLTAKNIKGWGVLVQPGSSTSNRGEHGQVIGYQAYACYVGLEAQAGTGAEYVNVDSPNITRCNTGIQTAAGNLNVVGGNITDNQYGVVIQNGSNHAHGIFDGVNINHNAVYNVQTTQVTNGQSFFNCHLYPLDNLGGGAIFMDKSKGIVFDGGVLDGWIYNYKDGSSGLNYIRNMYLVGDYGLFRQAGTNNGHDQLIITDCFGAGAIPGSSTGLELSGVTVNDVSLLHVYALRQAASSQSLTSGVAADLLFNTEVFDRRLVYDPATGVTTVNLAGQYRVRARMQFAGTAMSTTASIVELKVNGTAKRVSSPTVNSTTRLIIVLDEEIYLNSGDAVKLTATIGGTTPTFSDAAYDSFLSVERVA